MAIWDPTVADALVRAAREARAKGFGRVGFQVDGYEGEAAVKRTPEDDRRRYVFKRDWRVLLRVDAMAAKRGRKATGRDLDRVLQQWERALDALFHQDDAPFDMAQDLQTDDVAPDDRWASHLVTNGRFRVALWTVGRAWST